MSYRYQCSKPGCRTRKSLKRLYEQYIQKPKCPGCGEDSLKRSRSRELESKRNRCSCGELFNKRSGSAYPHEYGSKGCKHEDPKKIEQRRFDRINQALGAFETTVEGDGVPF